MLVDERSFERARLRMVEEQIRARGIRDDRVIAAMRGVPRHRFVDPVFLDQAYEDHPLPIGESQTISQPYMVALMAASLSLTGHETVLDIGTGSGYQAAVFARLCRWVYSIERCESLARKAQHRLSAMGYKNITVVVGDGTLGWEAHAPYEAIGVAAAAPNIPAPLAEQLVPAGRLCIPLGSRHSQVLVVGVKHGAALEIQEVCGCEFVPLIGARGWGARYEELSD